MINEFKIFENAIIFDGENDPYFDIDKVNKIYQKELKELKNKKIEKINYQIQLAEEENDLRLIKDLISQRKRIRSLVSEEIKTMEDVNWPNELSIDLTKFSFI